MSKKQQLKSRINEFIDVAVEHADKQGKLDFINIEISNHNGNLQMDYTLKDRKKVY